MNVGEVRVNVVIVGGHLLNMYVISRWIEVCRGLDVGVNVMRTPVNVVYLREHQGQLQ